MFQFDSVNIDVALAQRGSLQTAPDEIGELHTVVIFEYVSDTLVLTVARSRSYGEVVLVRAILPFVRRSVHADVIGA